VPQFEAYSDVSSRTLSLLVGETFILSDSLGEQTDTTIRGVFDRTIEVASEGDIPVRINQPNVTIRNVETNGPLLERSRWTLDRLDPETKYRIIDFNRDEVSTTRYILEEIG